MRIVASLGRVVLVFTLVLWLGALLPRSASAEEPNAGKVFLMGTGSVVATLFWGSGKIVYGVLGTVVGGLAYVLTGGRTDTARAIMQPALRGDYVVTPENLAGREPISFVGRDPRSEPYPYE